VLLTEDLYDVFRSTNVIVFIISRCVQCTLRIPDMKYVSPDLSLGERRENEN